MIGRELLVALPWDTRTHYEPIVAQTLHWLWWTIPAYVVAAGVFVFAVWRFRKGELR